MDTAEARRLLQQRVEEMRRLSHAQLRDTYLRRPGCHEVTGDSGATYYVETEAFWDDRKSGDLRVIVSIDDGRGWRAFCPLTDDFIIAPGGSLAGE